MSDYFDRYERIGQYDGLDRLGSLELSHESYQYDLIGAWKGADGFYLGTDSGCSCPTPWESTTRDDLTGPLTADQAREEVESHVMLAQKRQAEYTWRDNGGPDDGEVREFLALLS